MYFYFEYVFRFLGFEDISIFWVYLIGIFGLDLDKMVLEKEEEVWIVVKMF